MSNPTTALTSATHTTTGADAAAIREMVRDSYGQVAAKRLPSGCCTPSTDEASGCCEPGATRRDVSEAIGYTSDQLDSAPDDANLGLGCGNPTAIASLREGEVVLDLGSGAGLDAFIAAGQVGETGRVIGVDMTQEMLALARKNAVGAGLEGRVEFREGIIEALPVTSDSVDVLISNCVINLSPDKPAVFAEAFRVLKPGGRVAVSDILLDRPLPEPVKQLASVWAGCVAGAEVADTYLGHLETAGFTDVRWTRTSAAGMLQGVLSDPTLKQAIEAVGLERAQALAETVWSYRIEATKPEPTSAQGDHA